MVADTGSFGAGPPAAPSPPAAGAYDIGAPPPGFAPYQAADALGATSPVYEAQPAPMAQVPTAPMAAQMGQMEQMDDDLGPIPGTVGGANPIVTVLLIVLTCGIYGIYLLVKGKKSN
jgi:hypothetical protein